MIAFASKCDENFNALGDSSNAESECFAGRVSRMRNPMRLLASGFFIFRSLAKSLSLRQEDPQREPGHCRAIRSGSQLNSMLEWLQARAMSPQSDPLRSTNGTGLDREGKSRASKFSGFKLLNLRCSHFLFLSSFLASSRGDLLRPSFSLSLLSNHRR